MLRRATIVGGTLAGLLMAAGVASASHEKGTYVCDDPNTRPHNPVQSGNYIVHRAP